MQEQPNYCPQCGNFIPEGSAICASCTTSVTGTAPATTTTTATEKRLLLTPNQVFSLLPALEMLISVVVLTNSYTGWTSFESGAAGSGWLLACFSVGLTCSIVTVLEIFRVLRGVGKKWNSIGLANTIAFGYFTLYTIIFLIVNPDRERQRRSRNDVRNHEVIEREREGHHRAGQHAGHNHRHRHQAKRGEWLGPEVTGRLFEVAINTLESGLNRTGFDGDSQLVSSISEVSLVPLKHPYGVDRRRCCRPRSGGEEGVGLKDRVDVTAVGGQIGDVDVTEVNRSAGGLFEAARHAQCGRFAAARGAQQAEELTVVNLEC